MTNRSLLLSMFCIASIAPLAQANDFPTRARVEFVLACMKESKALPEDSLYNCSCAIDVIADKVSY
jgi:hypothetical protein